MSGWTNHGSNTIALAHKEARATIENTGKKYHLNLWVMDDDGNPSPIVKPRNFKKLEDAQEFVSLQLGLNQDVDFEEVKTSGKSPKSKGEKRKVNVITFGGYEISVFALKCLAYFSLILIALVYLRQNPQDALAIRRYGLGFIGSFGFLSAVLLIIDISQNGGKVTSKFFDYQIRRLKR